MRLISASRRTDSPAFYARWFLRRLAAGYCHWINPFNGRPHRVSLRPEDVAGIVCWTRNPPPLAGSLEELERRGYRFAFHFSLNGYPKEIESHNPPVAAALRAFRELAARLSPDRVWWRYDPILVTAATPPVWHVENFSRLAAALEGATRRCYFSFASFYRKVTRNLEAAGLEWVEPDTVLKLDLTDRLRRVARDHAIQMLACCDDSLLEAGVGKAHCVDSAAFPGAAGAFRPAPTRKDCGCSESVDIGAYDTCAFGCRYCYATNSRAAALIRLSEHDPEDSALWRPRTMRGRDLDDPATAGRP